MERRLPTRLIVLELVMHTVSLLFTLLIVMAFVMALRPSIVLAFVEDCRIKIVVAIASIQCVICESLGGFYFG